MPHPEVVFEADDVFGEGVNVAAHLETLAEPLRVFVSVDITETATPPSTSPAATTRPGRSPSASPTPTGTAAATIPVIGATTVIDPAASARYRGRFSSGRTTGTLQPV